MIPLDDSYVTYCIYHTPFTDEQRKQFIGKHQHKAKVDLHTMVKLKPIMSDAEIKRHLAEYDEQGFDDMPEWLQTELKARNLTFKKRAPTELEQWDTVSDAREHRIVNNEKILRDYQDKYIRGKSFSLIT